eukprot:749665-Hanusia_phi.AAC.2
MALSWARQKANKKQVVVRNVASSRHFKYLTPGKTSCYRASQDGNEHDPYFTYGKSVISYKY